jgi:hypothetical protein
VTTRASGIDELWRERLHPPVHRDVIDLDPALGRQLLDIAVGQPQRSTSAPPPQSPPAGSDSRPEQTNQIST